MPKTELLLVNSYALRQRVISDSALENSLAIIRTFLEYSNIKVEVMDDQRVYELDAGISLWLQYLLKGSTRLLLKLPKKKLVARLLFSAASPLHAMALHQREQYMQRRLNRIVGKVISEKIPMVGIKLWYGDAFVWAARLATAIKNRRPETIILVGGPQVKVYADLVLNEQGFDLAIMGPGEEIIKELVILKRRLSKSDFLLKVYEKYGTGLIKTGGYSEGKKDINRQLTTQTIPRYRQEDIDGKILFHTIVDGVGCSWNNCNFCSHSRCSIKFSPRPVKGIINEMNRMLKCGIGFFRFSCSETPVHHGEKIAEAILKKNWDIRFSMFIRAITPDIHSLEAYRLMVRAGLRAVFMGGETGHNDINKEIMNKGLDQRQIIDTIHMIRQAASIEKLPCRIGLSLIYPSPLTQGVTVDDVYQHNVQLILDTKPDTVIVNPPIPFPGTRWFDEADKFGFSFTQGKDNYLLDMMKYEYSNYRPASLWNNMNYVLQGKANKTLLKETARLRSYAEDIGIPTNLPDEYLMMAEAIGICTKQAILKFQKNTLVDIISGCGGYTRTFSQKVNAESLRLAKKSLHN